MACVEVSAFLRREGVCSGSLRPAGVQAAGTFGLRLLLLQFLCILLLGGCVSLPDPRPLLAAYHKNDTLPGVLCTGAGLTAEDGAPLLERLREEAGCTDVLRGHLCLTEAAGGSPVVCGNTATLLINGDVTFAAMLRAIGEAKDHINFETYIFSDDEVGRLFADLLVRKRAEGVKVNLIYDSFGCRGTPRSFFDRLREAGVRTVEFNPVSWFNLFSEKGLFHRTHRKLLIVDGKVAFTGGINIGKAYLKVRRPGDGTADPEQFWRDTDVMIEGPAVGQFQKLFLTTWVQQKGDAETGAVYFPPIDKKGDQLVQAVGASYGVENRTNYLMYLSAIAHARKSVHLTQSYFAPDALMLETLKEAAARGVDVRIILPETTDHDILRQAGRRRYAQLLESGVRVYECRGAILHAKTAVIDGVWSTVGSTNLERWSLAVSNEIDAVVLGPDFGGDMERCFETDLARSREILPGEWRHRPLFERLKQLFSGLLDQWL
jgi:cardiolipin synthase